MKLYRTQKMDGMYDVRLHKDAMLDVEHAIEFRDIGLKHIKPKQGGVYVIPTHDLIGNIITVVGGAHCSEETLPRLVRELHENGWREE